VFAAIGQVSCYTQRSFDGKTDKLLNGTTERAFGIIFSMARLTGYFRNYDSVDVLRILTEIRIISNCRSRPRFGPPMSIVDTTYHSPPNPLPSLSRAPIKAYSAPDPTLLYPASR
jgi:hypothetical protein